FLWFDHFQCSEACGSGWERREVTCHLVSPNGWEDPDPVDRGCKRSKKPRDRRKCNLGPCSEGFFWKPKPWKKCSAVCESRGRQRRSVGCVNAWGIRVHKSHCPNRYKPKRKQKCQGPVCGPATCSQTIEKFGTSRDGEYQLLVGGKNMSIYCLGMDTLKPREYLTLPAGEEGNFAEVYDKRLLDPKTCPNNGERHENCQCTMDESGRAGFSTFSKLRIDTESMVIITYDFTFAKVLKGRWVPFGEAGDCFSTAQCPQGAFSVNLAGTDLRISSRTKWVAHGINASISITTLDNNQRILGRCGGYCGTCNPDPNVGLKLDLRDG
ncbi:unnamed protein product, partial [Meganyctiphanes norvegica]